MSVIALAGRRVDAPGAETPRFAVEDVPLVADRLETALRELGVTVLIASAAAGADLLGLRAAHELGARTVIVLPFDVDRFERSSVDDRPGAWSQVYREMLEVSEVNVLSEPFEDDDAAYAAVTEALVARASALGGDAGTAAVVVWDGAARGPSDMTAMFARCARERGLRVVEVSTRS